MRASRFPGAGGERLALLWAVAEATCWPIMPDAALVPLATRRPACWWRLALAATAGSCLGGLLSHAIGRATPARTVLGHLPLVRGPMVEAADGWLSQEGSLALRHQPLSGIPFKVFALLAGSRGLPLIPFVVSTAIFRGARFAAVGAAAALLGQRFQTRLARRGRLLLALWAVAFAVGLRRMVRSWERRRVGGDSPPHEPVTFRRGAAL